jgi:1-acyl-sn-glycerol-3-phosphate acyltransferase
MVQPPHISRRVLRFFRGIVRGYFRRNFHAVRASGSEHASGVSGPLIVYANHSSWWDPMVAFLLGEALFPGRDHYAPMDASALARYRILTRLGIFPVEINSTRGAVQFLRMGECILSAGGVLWITPQGRFADVREQPLVFKPGLAALAGRVAAKYGSCTLLPLAIEYPFWDERLPECLLRVGPLITIDASFSSGAIEQALGSALQHEMSWLASAAIARSPVPFATLVTGSAGTGGFYALARRIKAMLLRRPYVAEHSPTPATVTAASSEAR